MKRLPFFVFAVLLAGCSLRAGIDWSKPAQYWRHLQRARLRSDRRRPHQGYDRPAESAGRLRGRRRHGRRAAGYYLTGSIVLGANTTLRLESRANLLGSPDLADYPLLPAVRWEANSVQGTRASLGGEGRLCRD